MAEEVLTNDQIIEALKKKTIIELNELVKRLEEEFGVSAMAPAVGFAPGVGAAAPAAAAAPAVEEQTEFTVILKDAGKEKIKVIKEVRAVTNLGLKEAKDLVEGAPKEVVKDVTKEESENVKKKLEAVGAVVEIK
jgi:large subunit ribosomal protein L7/L12